MRKSAAILPLTALLFGLCAAAQNTGAHATPQTDAAAPAGAKAQPRAGTGNSRTGASATGGRTSSPAASGSGRPGTTRGQGNSTRPPAPAANSVVEVIGDSNKDGLLDREGAAPNSAALPGVVLPHNAIGIQPGTPIQVRLQRTVDSGHAHNGDTVQGFLLAPLGRLSAGTPVSLTVVAAAAAGELGSSGVLSLQVVSVNGEQMLSQVVTAEGKEGKKTLPDDAPARGTEAVFTPDQPISLPAA